MVEGYILLRELGYVKSSGVSLVSNKIYSSDEVHAYLDENCEKVYENTDKVISFRSSIRGNDLGFYRFERVSSDG